MSDAVELFRRVFDGHGIRIPRGALSDAFGEHVTIERFCEIASGFGLEVKLARVSGKDLSFLEEGSVVGIGGAFGVVAERTPRGAILELADKRRVAAEPSAKEAGVAAVISRRGSAHGNLLEVLRRRLRDDATVKRGWMLAVVLGVFASALGIAGPIVSRLAINEALPAGATSELRILAIVSVAVGLHVAWARHLRRRAIAYLETKLSDVASSEAFGRMLRLPFANARDHTVGNVFQALRSSSEYAAALPRLVTPIVDAVVAVGYLGFLLFLDATTALCVLVFGAVALPLGFLHGKRTARAHEKVVAATRQEQQGLFEILGGIETIKVQGGEGGVVGEWLARLVAEQQANVRFENEKSRLTSLLSLLERGAFLSALALAGHRALADDLPIGDMVAALQATTAFMASFQALARLPSDWILANAHRKETDAVFALTEEDARSDEAVTEDASIDLRDVWFRYGPGCPWVLRGMTFFVEGGAHVLLRWPSGAGKTTLLRLLSGLLAPERGDVLIGGVEAARARSRVCYVPQTASLLSLSVMDNLRALSGGASPERIARAAAATGLADVVRHWPMGFETLVGPGARSISSGQRQLVLLTAAVASSKPILLLDEAFAHLDALVRERLAKAGLLSGRTVVSVVHDATPAELALGATLLAEP